MICPRCSNEILENESICPYCHSEIHHELEFNDYKAEGFVHLKFKDSYDGNTKTRRYKAEDNKYFKTTRYLMIVSVIFLLCIAVVTIFGFKALQRLTNDTPADVHVEPYVPTYSNSENEMNNIKNTIKKVSVKNLYGSWKNLNAVEQNNQAIPYFSFAEDGAAQYDFGSYSVLGYFDDYSSKNKNIIYLEIQNQLCGLYAFDVTGNPDDGYRLTLKNINSGLTYYFESAEAKTYKLKLIEGSSIDEKVVGTWESRNGIRKYIFYKDGKFSRHVDNQIMNGVWCKSKQRDNAIDLKYMEGSIVEITINYTFYESSLIINDMMYYKK